MFPQERLKEPQGRPTRGPHAPLPLGHGLLPAKPHPLRQLLLSHPQPLARRTDIGPGHAGTPDER
jgi:hypothetical protein